MGRRVRRIYNNFMDAITLPEMRILPGQIAFCFLMSFVPIIAIITMIASYISKNFDLLTVLETTLPDSLANIIINIISTNPSYNIIIIFACYIMLASNGPGAIIIASDTLYGIQPPNYIKLKLKSIIMIIVLTVLLVFLLFIPVLGDTIVKIILKFVSNPEKFYAYAGVYKLLKTLLTFILVYFNIKLLYTLAPDKKIKSRKTTVGAIFTTITWIISTEAFAFYITKIAKYNLIYGNFANVLIILTWVYLLAYLFVVGMALNANQTNKSDIIN